MLDLFKVIDRWLCFDHYALPRSPKKNASVYIHMKKKVRIKEEVRGGRSLQGGETQSG